jgi:hypothetical protein
MRLNPLAHALGNVGWHHLRAPRCGIHVAMRASLVALAPDVDLQRLELSPPQSQRVFGQFGFKAIHVSGDENTGIARIFQESDRQRQPFARLIQAAHAICTGLTVRLKPYIQANT